MTAYVGNPAKVSATWAGDVTVVVGELNNATAVDRAVQAPTQSSARSGPV